MSDNIDFVTYSRECELQAFYLKVSQESIFVWQHTPKASNIKNKIVIICPAIGYEYKHAYRSLRRLADYLCAQGFIVFRFDYYGIGNSSGSTLSGDYLQVWIDNIQTLSAFVAQKYPDIKQCMTGFRMGGTLAALAANNDIVDSLVLWEPIIKGRSYIRELEVISKLSSAEGDFSDDYIETAGFMLSKITAEKIKKINITNDIQFAPNMKILQLVRDDAPVDDRFSNHLKEQDIDIELHYVEGYTDMIAEPHKTKTPIVAIQYLTHWLIQHSEEIQKPVAVQAEEDNILNLYQDTQAKAEIKEQPVFFGEEESLFGILSSPVIENIKSTHCIILSNSGSVHHVGPSSIYTIISRELATLGYLVFRIDLENIGDSNIVDAEFENHPYQPNAVANIDSAIQYIKQNTSADKFVLSGICSGAHTIFHAGVELTGRNISKVLMINPLTFYWEQYMSLEIPDALRVFKKQAYYKEKIFSFDKWLKLTTGKADSRKICSFVFHRIIEFFHKSRRDIVSLFIGERTPLALDLKKIHENGAKVGFIFSSTDPGLDIVKSQASRTLKQGIKENWLEINIVNDSDHTFSRKVGRDNLLSILADDFEKFL